MKDTDTNKLAELYESKILTNEMAYGRSQNAKEISEQELINNVKIADAQGTRPISFTAVTDARAKKTNNPHGTIYKISQVQGWLGVDYTKQKEEAQKQENEKRKAAGLPPVEAKPVGPSRGEHLSTSLIEMNGSIYLIVQFDKDKKPNPSRFAKIDQNGNVVELKKEEINNLLPPPKPDEASKMAYRNYKLSNIISGTLLGTEFKVKDVNSDKLKIVNSLGL
jgi:hypothetical protein